MDVQIEPKEALSYFHMLRLNELRRILKAYGLQMLK